MAAQKTILPNDMMRQNISIMNKSSGFSVVIVCCSSKAQARYWQKRLEEGRGSVLQKSTIVLSVEEDWPGICFFIFLFSFSHCLWICGFFPGFVSLSKILLSRENDFYNTSL